MHACMWVTFICLAIAMVWLAMHVNMFYGAFCSDMQLYIAIAGTRDYSILLLCLPIFLSDYSFFLPRFCSKFQCFAQRYM